LRDCDGDKRAAYRKLMRARKNGGALKEPKAAVQGK